MYQLFSSRRDFNEDISRWNVSNVVDMGYIFYYATSFNGDLSCWDVGRVRSMDQMFFGATSFTHQLGGAWATSKADQFMMFLNSPGTITGKTKDAHGTMR